MKTLDRYALWFFAWNVVFSLVGMILFFLFQSMFTNIYEHRYRLGQIFFYHWMNLPRIFVEMAPPATLLATVLTLSKLSRTHELIAYFAVGIGLRRIMMHFLGFVLILCSLIFVMEDRILPVAHKKRTTYYWREMQNKIDFFMDIKKDKIWYRSNHMIYNLQRFDTQSKTLFGMSIYTFDDHFNLIQVIGAERAAFTEKGWNLLNGTVSVFSQGNPFPLTKDFQEKEIIIKESPKDFQEIEKEVDGLSFKELYHYILRMKNAGADTKTYVVKLHSRLSLCFIPIVMCVLAIPFSVSTTREGGLARDLCLCLMITFSYWLFYSLGLSLGNRGVLPPWVAAWLPSGGFTVLAIKLISRKY